MTLRLAARLAWLATGGGWLVWLALEDQTVVGPLLIALGAAAAGWLTSIARFEPAASGRRRRLIVLAIGLMVGAALTPLAAVLMLVKVSLHSHPVPDFETAQVWSVLARLPIWSVIGLLLSAAYLTATAAGGPAGVEAASRVEYNETDPPTEKRPVDHA